MGECTGRVLWMRECTERADPSLSSSFLKRTSNKASFQARKAHALQEKFGVYYLEGILPPSWSTYVPKLYNIAPTHYPSGGYP